MSYKQRKVTIKELFESGQTKEPSIKALRTRADEGILVFLESMGNVYYYDEQLSIIRDLAARKCKRPGVRWKDIKNAFKKSGYSPEKIIEMLNHSKSKAEIVNEIANELSAILL